MLTTLTTLPVIMALFTLAPQTDRYDRDCHSRCGTLCVQLHGLTDPEFTDCYFDCVNRECPGGSHATAAEPLSSDRLDCDVEAGR